MIEPYITGISTAGAESTKKIAVAQMATVDHAVRFEVADPAEIDSMLSILHYHAPKVDCFDFFNVTLGFIQK